MSSLSLHRGDVLTVLKSLPDESVNAVIIDPPYNSGGRTGSECTSRDARAKYVTSSSAHDLKTSPGENRDQRSYRSWLTELLTEAYRASTEHAVAVVFSDWRQEPTTSDALQMAGWTWQGTIPGIKPAGRPRKGGFKQSAEFITWGVKGALDHSRVIYLPGHFIATQPREDRAHITQKPLEITRQLVRISPEGGVALGPVHRRPGWLGRTPPGSVPGDASPPSRWSTTRPARCGRGRGRQPGWRTVGRPPGELRGG
ncbi:methyltransferase [Kitasatospora griseola]|nr:methyltransferase [Kitasatospora griseola]